MPEEQQVLFEKIAERTSNIVTVVITGRPLDLRRISERSKAVIMAWRPGTMGAEAITDIVYGRINPSGQIICEYSMVCGTGAHKLLGCKNRTYTYRR